MTTPPAPDAVRVAADAQPWPAPHAERPLDATVDVPGSKSLTNRYLVLAALADGPSLLRSALRSRDTMLMAAALGALGVDVTTDTASDWRVTPGPLRGGAAIDCGLAGTVMRFLPPVAALSDGPVAFVDDDGRGTLPFSVHGTGGVRGGTIDIDASASSQFVSGLLLAAARFDEGLTLRHVGVTLPSRPHIDMTVQVLRSAGVVVDDSIPTVWRAQPGTLA